MPNVRKVIKDIVSAPFNKYDKWQSDANKQTELENKIKANRNDNIYSAQEHERRKMGDLSGPGEMSIAMREFSLRNREIEKNKARGTSSSSVRKIIK